jgi:FAD/FMN-containing dehydrogenase
MLTLKGLKEGIQIDMRALNKVDVLPDGKYAWIGGGIKQGDLINALAAAKKRTGSHPASGYRQS